MSRPPLLIDLDGVLRIGNRPAEGLTGFIHYLRENRIPCAILSNTTKLPDSEIRLFFDSNGISIEGIPVITALKATARYASKYYRSIALYCGEAARTEFIGIEESSDPDAVVIGDLGKGWSYEVMNLIFRQVMNGADIIAMQMNKFGKAEDGLYLDAGSFISAIEYASGKKAVLMGKPSPLFFESALQELGYNKGCDFLMMGDDLDADIFAAQQAGGKAMLVLTGKTGREAYFAGRIKADYVAEDLPETISIIASSCV